jgi:hypothetical protein
MLFHAETQADNENREDTLISSDRLLSKYVPLSNLLLGYKRT